MIPGTANENAVLMALSARPFVRVIFECGMVAKADASWLACCTASIDIIATQDLFPIINQTSVEQNGTAITSVEIKTSVESSSLDRDLGNATLNIISYTVGDGQFHSYIPKEHIGQIIQQRNVLCLNRVVYVSADEVGLLYIVVV